MANILPFITLINRAVLGEEVRGAITDALTAMNNEIILGGGALTVNKFSELPLIGRIAAVLQDEVISQEAFELDADTEYGLLVNPQMPLDKSFSVALTSTETSKYDDNQFGLSVNLINFSAPLFFIAGSITDGDNSTIKLWYYTADGATYAGDKDVPAMSILAGWSYVEILNGAVVTNEAVNYTKLPDLTGKITVVASEVDDLGGAYLSEEPYNMNKAGVYYFDTELEAWVRNDKDTSLWCEATGFLAKAGGYGNNATGDGSFAGGGYGNSATGDWSFVGGGYGNSASTRNSAIFGQYGETTPHTLFCVGNGISSEEKTLAFNVESYYAEFSVPTVSPKKLEYYSQFETVLICNILNTFITFEPFELVLPNAPNFGFFGEFKLLISVQDSEHFITFNEEVEWEDATPYIFSEGVHMVTAFYNNFTNKWALSGRKYGLPPS